MKLKEKPEISIHDAQSGACFKKALEEHFNVLGGLFGPEFSTQWTEDEAGVRREEYTLLYFYHEKELAIANVLYERADETVVTKTLYIIRMFTVGDKVYLSVDQEVAL